MILGFPNTLVVFWIFELACQAQRLLSTNDQINTIFRPRRHILTATSHRQARADVFGLGQNRTDEMNA
ncbi:hypothetical protein [Labrenzia sp. THAF82]|uniref:hypothetical protein n=1 Tax=Labrenzia sp. THAF82 TaxID=2587861 RepID=UPI001AD94B19